MAAHDNEVAADLTLVGLGPRPLAKDSVVDSIMYNVGCEARNRGSEKYEGRQARAFAQWPFGQEAPAQFDSSVEREDECCRKRLICPAHRPRILLADQA